MVKSTHNRPFICPILLWDGEEQNFLGSRGYVEEHFGDPVTMTLKPAHDKISAYFNLDTGGGKILSSV